MKNLYKEFFYIPKHGKIREKVMLAHVAATVIILIGCLAAISLSAYAFFSDNITSGANIIKAANYDLQVTVTEGGASVNVTDTGKVYTSQLAQGKTYTVTLTRKNPETAAKTGFCVISASGCSEVYHTRQIENGSFTFTLTATADTTVRFSPNWGTSSYYGGTDAHYVTDTNNSITLTIGGSLSASPSASNETAGTTTQSVPVTTASATAVQTTTTTAQQQTAGTTETTGTTETVSTAVPTDPEPTDSSTAGETESTTPTDPTASVPDETDTDTDGE